MAAAHRRTTAWRGTGLEVGGGGRGGEAWFGGAAAHAGGPLVASADRRPSDGGRGGGGGMVEKGAARQCARPHPGGGEGWPESGGAAAACAGARPAAGRGSGMGVRERVPESFFWSPTLSRLHSRPLRAASLFAAHLRAVGGGGRPGRARARPKLTRAAVSRPPKIARRRPPRAAPSRPVPPPCTLFGGGGGRPSFGASPSLARSIFPIKTPTPCPR